MKRLIGILCIWCAAVFAYAGVHTYAKESALSKGTIIKIRVSETGVHKLPYDSLTAWGLNANNVSVLGYGGGLLSENFSLTKWDDLPAVPFYMHKGSDNVFNSGDYILFYAQGPVKWDCDKNGQWRHTQNPYSHYGYYFVTDNASHQKKITLSTQKYDTNNVTDVDWYTAYSVHEKDELNLIDATGVNGGGREFYGEVLNIKNKNVSIQFPMQNVRTDKNTYCKVDLAAYSSESTTVKVNYAGTTTARTLPAISISDYYTKAVTDSVIVATKANSKTTQIVNIYFTSTTSSAVTYLNYVEINAPCDLIMRGNELHITNACYLGQRPAIRYHLEGASAQMQIWRVTDGVNIEQMPTEWIGEKLTWVGNNTAAEKYVAVNPSITLWKMPVKVGQIANQNLHKLENIDYVIICPSEFVEPAKRLAKKHEEVDHITWAVVTDQQVYNEFSSGTPDASAYRWLMKMLYDRGIDNTTRPKNLLLLGDGTFDNRKILSRSGWNKLLTYQAKNSTVETAAYACDDYFGFLTDKAGVSQNQFSESRAQMNIGVGRLPAKTLEEANAMVDKLCTYMDDRILNKWKSQILFLADDGDHGLHVQTAEAGAERLRKKNKDFIVNKLYLDAHTQEVSAAGESYPLAKNQFDNLMSNGVLFMNYSGHGGYNNITNELFMKIADIQRMNNANQAFWFLATCSFSHFDSGVNSAGEEAVLNPNGGAIGVLSACRTVYATQNTTLNRNLCDTILGHKNAFDYSMTLGEAIRAAKNNTGNDANKLAYVFLGDPALRLNYPTDYQVRTTTELDTIHALTVQTIKGFIQTSDLDTASWFNGKLDITIFDKMQEITTRDNDEINEANKVKIKYNDYPNALFVGQTDVKDGKFEFTFMVPKDIRYNYGNGRIVYYAHDPEAREEAIGHFEDFVIGGSSSVIAKDTIGPELHIYLNNPAFQNGDETYEFPHFYADIYDENGINTAGTGIGHDLLMVIDEDPKQTYILNSYFQTSTSYKQGHVSYKMSEQTEGAHTLTFRAWDLYNNSNTASLNFQVVKGMDPEIYSVVSYPNPVSTTGVLNIQIEFNQPDEIIDATIYLYDLSGKLVYTYQQRGAEMVNWNMSNINAEAGIYVYQVKIKTTTSNYVSKAGKIIITQ